MHLWTQLLVEESRAWPGGGSNRVLGFYPGACCYLAMTSHYQFSKSIFCLDFGQIQRWIVDADEAVKILVSHSFFCSSYGLFAANRIPVTPSGQEYGHEEMCFSVGVKPGTPGLTRKYKFFLHFMRFSCFHHFYKRKAFCNYLEQKLRQLVVGTSHVHFLSFHFTWTIRIFKKCSFTTNRILE